MVVVRQPRPSDLAEMVALQNDLVATTTFEWTEDPHTVDEMASRVENETVLVADLEGTVVGWAGYGDFRDATRWPGYRVSAEHTIHVRRDHWGTGVGRALLTALMDLARAEGKKVLIAGVDATNLPSLAFHARLGFDEVGRLPGVGVKWDRPLDLVLLQRHL